MASEHFFDANGVRLHYLDWGGTGKNMVLLAGLGDNAQIFNGLAPKLTSHCKVFGLTRRGHGGSEKPVGGYDIGTLIDDIRQFLDYLAIERTILVGHSFAGLEMPHFVILYPERVEAIIYLDALFPKLDPEPDLSGDPTWSVIPTGEPTEDDLQSKEAYLGYYKRARPDWARIWCEAIEANLMDRVTVLKNGRLEFHHVDRLMNRILGEVYIKHELDYSKVKTPMMAVVPNGDYHPSVPQEATNELRRAANEHWNKKSLPWIRQRSDVLRKAAPKARIVELDSPFHHIFIAKEGETLKAINDFVADISE